MKAEGGWSRLEFLGAWSASPQVDSHSGLGAVRGCWRLRSRLLLVELS